MVFLFFYNYSFRFFFDLVRTRLPFVRKDERGTIDRPVAHSSRDTAITYTESELRERKMISARYHLIDVSREFRVATKRRRSTSSSRFTFALSPLSLPTSVASSFSDGPESRADEETPEIHTPRDLASREI